MLVSNSPMSVVRSNNNLNKSRSTVYKHKAKFFKNPDLQQAELELVSEEVQAELNKQIKQENRVRRIGNFLLVTLVFVAIVGVLIWLM